MPSPVSRPVAAALGLVPTVLDGVRHLPGKAVQLPVYAVSHALTSIGAARQGYDDLAERGERLIARLRGTSFDEVEDRVEDALQGTPLAKPYDLVEDALEDVGESVTSIARNAAQSVAGRGGSGTTSTPAKASAPKKKSVDPKAAAKAVAVAERHVAEAARRAEQATAEAAEKAAAAGLDPQQAERQRQNPAQAAKGKATPKATQPDDTRIDTAAAPDVVQTVEQVSSRVGGTVLEHDELPLPDYDHLTLGALRGRMRSLDLPQLISIRAYEKAHADRLPIVTMLDNRIAKLANDPTAPLSGSDPAKATAAPEKAKNAKPGKAKATPQTADAGASTPGVAFGGLGSSSPA